MLHGIFLPHHVAQEARILQESHQLSNPPLPLLLFRLCPMLVVRSRSHGLLQPCFPGHAGQGFACQHHRSSRLRHLLREVADLLLQERRIPVQELLVVVEGCILYVEGSLLALRLSSETIHLLMRPCPRRSREHISDGLIIHAVEERQGLHLPSFVEKNPNRGLHWPKVDHGPHRNLAPNPLFEPDFVFDTFR